MSPEERFDKIENVLQRTAEQQAGHEREIDKQNDAIRSLIIVARTCLDSIREMRENHDADYKRLSTKIEEISAATDEKLNILVDTVDRIIRRENHP